MAKKTNPVSEADSVQDVTVESEAVETEAVESEAVETDAMEAEAVETEDDTETPTSDVVEIEQEAPATAEPIVEKRSVFLPAVLGGIIAAGFGFVAAKSDVIDGLFPNSKADQAAAFEQAMTDQTSQIDALKGQIAALTIPDVSKLETNMAAITATVSPLSASILGLKTQLDGLNTQITALSDRITAVEKRPISEGVSQSAIDAYEAELSKLQATMATQRAEVEALIKTARSVEADAKQTKANAAGVLQVTANKALLAELRSALETGSPFKAILTSLADNGVTIPDDLSASATGVPTLAALQEAFPDVARAALAVSRDANPDKGLGAFLRRQLGARSVAPRDGTDADAVLSRAEAALTNGQIQATLDELATLPDDVTAALAGWSAQAKSRITAAAAVDALGRELNTK